jgi:GT2 family glycosyltransferase
MADPTLAVIIVTYNSRGEIDACLRSLYADLGDRAAEIVVVDNASPDGTAEHVAQTWPDVRVLAQRINRGFAAANNLGLQVTTGDLALLLNPDTVVQPGAVDALIAVLKMAPTVTLSGSTGQGALRRDASEESRPYDGDASLESHRNAAHGTNPLSMTFSPAAPVAPPPADHTSPNVGIVGPMLLNADGSLQPSQRDFPTLLGDLMGMAELYRLAFVRRLFGRRMTSLSDHRTAGYVPWLSGACLLVRRAAAMAAGPLDEGFFMYSEEMEWQYRMAQHGWRAWFEPAARVTHLGGASTAQVGGQRIVWQYQSIFRFYRLYRNRGQRLALRLLVWAITWPKVIFLILAGGGQSHRQGLRRAFWRVLWLN